jgi:hypothetical protein
LTTIDSQAFLEETSTCAVAPVLAPVVVAAPVARVGSELGGASELIFTLRAALR